MEGMLRARQEVERCIAMDPFFKITYFPYTSSCTGTTLQRMEEASAKAGVGPMAAVAGAIAWMGVEAIEKEGGVYGVIDNGGDIALLSDRIVRVGVYAGAALSGNRLAFLVPPQEEILGICTSSATVGHSVSLGVADAVTVFSHNVAAADAWATSICNQFSQDDDFFIRLTEDAEIMGVLVISGDSTRTWGDLPPLVSAHVDADLITRGRAALPLPPGLSGRHPVR
jgi:hypothetical protein